MKISVFLILSIPLLITSCGSQTPKDTMSQEDPQAKEMMQGLWVSDGDGEAAMLVKGDSIYYPDSASMPARFWIYQDTLYLEGQNVNGYKILKQASHLLMFDNQNGDEVKLVKSSNKMLVKSFDYHVYAMNMFATQQSDTTVFTDQGYYDCAVSIRTSSDRVVKSTYNDYGIEVDNMYLDNIAALVIKNHGSLIYAHDFRKGEFQAQVPKEMMEHSILRQFYFDHADRKALYFNAVIGVPDASTSYVLEVRITPDGNVTKKLK